MPKKVNKTDRCPGCGGAKDAAAGYCQKCRARTRRMAPQEAYAEMIVAGLSVEAIARVVGLSEVAVRYFLKAHTVENGRLRGLYTMLGVNVRHERLYCAQPELEAFFQDLYWKDVLQWQSQNGARPRPA